MSRSVHSVKLQPYDSIDLNRLSYSDGDVVYDQTNDTLRVMDGSTQGGTILATRTWTSSTISLLSGNAVLSDNPPVAPTARSGTLWFNTSSGKLYIYYNDGTSLQWVQPMTPSYNTGGGGGSGTVNSGTAGQLTYYASTGSAVAGLSNIGWANNTLSITGGINANAQKNYIRFHWDTLTDLNTEAPPGTWHGMVAHVHDTGRLYVAHSATWLPLALLSDVAVTSIQAGTNVTVSSVGGVYTINASTGGGGGGITTEDAQDATASLFSNGIQTGISFSYNDVANSLSATVGTVALGTGTSGNYVASVQTGSGITGGSAGSAGAAISLAIDTAVVGTLTGTQTLTNKTISGTTNTLTNIPNGSLTSSSITINGQSVSLGGTVTISTASTLESLTNVTITGVIAGQVLKYNGTRWINDVDATSGGAGVGTVTSVSVTSANGFTGTVATANSTPAITITTSITGVLKGNGTAISAATSGTDYAPGTSALLTGIVKSTTTTGALTIAVAGTDYQAPIGTISGIVKGNGANALTAAVSGTDYQAPVSATGILKSSGVSGNVSAAVAGTDYQAPISTSGILKSSGVSGNVSSATAGTDYQAPITFTTTGSSGAATFNGTALNIPQYASGAFSGLSDATSAGLSVAGIYLQATTKLTVTANGSSAYLFDQYSGNNPTIYVTAGTTIAFDLGTGALSSHPFLIRFSGANYDTGLTHVTSAGVVTTGSAAQAKTSGTLYWKIPASISGTYGYLCQVHGGMIGTITINPAGSLAAGSVTAATLSAGMVVQTQYVASATRVSTTHSGWQEPSTGYRVTITPVFSNSMLIVKYHIPFNQNSASNVLTVLRAFRSVGGTKTYALTSAGSTNGNRNVIAGGAIRPGNGFDSNDQNIESIQAVDFPATTSAVTYGFESAPEAANTTTWGYTASDNATWGYDADIVIIVQEIKQ